MGAIDHPSQPVCKNNKNVQNCEKYAPNLTFSARSLQFYFQRRGTESQSQ